ncbi:MAG TPA: hypothetical protein VNN62_07100 [Methylomirabilota bacterium]|jgi:hypothetical protein|nr:hypothetical protein [Methylomirabilota bacterium]
MKTRLVLITLVLLGLGQVFFLKQGKADSGGVPAQLARLQATVNAIKDAVLHLDPTIIGETTLTTGMLLAALNDRIACNVVNVSETQLIVSISIVSSFGDVVLNNTTAVLSHRAVGITADFAFPGYCRFNFSGAPNAVRANGALQEEVDGLLGSFKFVTEAR